MKPLYTENDFENSKSGQLLHLECLHCKKIFARTKHFIQVSLWNMKNRKRKYACDFCSNKCFSAYVHPIIPLKKIPCDQCNKLFFKTRFAVKATKHNFCSHSCSAIYSNAHKTKGTRVSKLEVWIQNQIQILYPNLEIHFNRKDAIKSELDI